MKGDVSWKEYENAVYRECERIFNAQDAELVKDAHVEGRYSGVKRQIDILIRLLKDGYVDSTCLVECKHSLMNGLLMLAVTTPRILVLFLTIERATESGM